MRIFDYLTLNAQRCPYAEAVVYVESNDYRDYLSWEDFETMSNQVANFLRSKNMKKGDKVGLLLHNSIVWLPIYFGLLKSGVIAVLLNYNNSVDELEYCVDLSECKGLFLSREDKCYELFVNKKLWVCDCENVIETKVMFEKYSANFEVCDISLDDVAAIYFSSGTTGYSKAILISHASLASSATMENAHHKQSCDDRFLCLCPLYHTGAKIHWFGSLVVGGPIVLYNSTFSPKNLLQVVEQEKITIAFLLVPQIQDVVDAIDIGDVTINDYDLSRWRLMHSGAQHVPQNLIKQWKKHFSFQSYDTNYGLTESTGPGCIHLGMENFHKVGAIGRADSNWEIDIVDNNGKSVKTGETGELIVKGPGVMIEYFKDQPATIETIIDGWLYTGDMAYMDEDNFVYLVGRKKDIIISGGENIYPIQIENYFRKIHCIKDVAVIGYNNRRMGELVAVVIELCKDAQITKGKIINFCADLPMYQRPSKYIFNKVIRNAMGKLDKNEMRRRYL